MGRISRKYSVDSYTQALILCHKKLYFYTLEQGTGNKIPVSAYIKIVNDTIIERNIKGAIIKHDFRTTVRQGTLFEIQPD